MELYAGIELHSYNRVVVLLDTSGLVRFHRRLPNDLGAIVSAVRS